MIHRHHRAIMWAIAAAWLGLSGWTGWSAKQQPPASPPAAPRAPGGSAVLPDANLTPGAVLTSDVATICVSGYTATVRNVPTSEKQAAFAAYGLSYPQPRGTYEADHLIPLELGGANDQKNIWPQPASPAPGFHEKDRLENKAHAEVCAGRLGLAEAQHRISSDWYTFWLDEGSP